MTTPQTRLQEVARNYFRLVDDGNVAAAFDLFEEDAVYRRPGQAPLEGKDAIVAFYRGPRGIERTHHDVEVVATDGPCVVVEGKARVWWEDDRRSEFRFIDVFWFRGGRIHRRHGYVDAPLP